MINEMRAWANFLREKQCKVNVMQCRAIYCQNMVQNLSMENEIEWVMEYEDFYSDFYLDRKCSNVCVLMLFYFLKITKVFLWHIFALLLYFYNIRKREGGVSIICLHFVTSFFFL